MAEDDPRRAELSKTIGNPVNNKDLFLPKKERKVVPYSEQSSSPTLLSGMTKCRCRIRLGDLMFSKGMDNFILLVIIMFSILTFISLSIDESYSYFIYIEIIELVLLVLFLIELLLKFFACGFVFPNQVYWKSVWNVFDFSIVTLSLVFAALTLSNGSQTIGFLKFTVILRLLRLTVAFRKFSEFKRIKDKIRKKGLSTEFSVDVASERVIDILTSLLLEPWLHTNPDLFRDVEWCIEIICSNKLQEAIVTVASGTEKKSKEEELLTIVNQYSAMPNPSSAHYPRRRSSNIDKSQIPVNLGDDMKLEVKECFKDVNTNDFNVFELKKLTNGNELFTLMHLLFNQKALFKALGMNIAKFKSFVSRVQSGYNVEVPYHNATHAADVAQTLHYFITTCGAGDIMQLSSLEIAGCYIAGCVHDFEHPGVNNIFLVNTQSELAIRYNDKSVLESHHVSASFALAMNEEYDIYAVLSPSDYGKIRGQIIEMVLSTDIVHHFTAISQFKNKFPTSREILPEDKSLCFQVLIHAADISNPSKSWELCFAWTELVISEFWAQGDREREMGLPLGYLMDRYTVNIAKSQVGFIDVIVWPAYEALKVEFPALSENCGNLMSNKEEWKRRISRYEENMQILTPPKAKLESTTLDNGKV